MKHKESAAPPLKTPEGTSSPWWACRALMKGLSWNRDPVGWVWDAGWKLRVSSPLFHLFCAHRMQRAGRCLCREQSLTLRALRGFGHADSAALPWQPQLSFSHACSGFLLSMSCSNTKSHQPHSMESPCQQQGFYSLTRLTMQSRGTSRVLRHWVHTRLTEDLQGKGKGIGNLGMAEVGHLSWVTAFSPQEPGGGTNTVGIHHTLMVFSAMESSCGSGMGSQDHIIPSLLPMGLFPQKWPLCVI